MNFLIGDRFAYIFPDLLKSMTLKFFLIITCSEILIGKADEFNIHMAIRYGNIGCKEFKGGT